MALETVECTVEQNLDTLSSGDLSSPVPFGGDGQWLYLPDTKKFDLSRGSEWRLIIESDEAVRNHSGFIIDPENSVLVIVDMQNYFIHPTYRDHAAGLAAVDPILRVLERCRREGIQVVWLNWGITEEDLRAMSPAVSRIFSKSFGWHVALGAQLPGDQGRCLFKETWNSQLYGPLKDSVKPNDLFFDKTRMSGLWSTEEPFHKYLRESGKTTLLFSGVNTDQCVFGTLADACSWGWDCVLLGDCTGTMTKGGAQELCDYQVTNHMGFVTDSEAFCDAEMLLTTPLVERDGVP